MNDNIDENKFVELRKEFYKETNTFAMTNKKGYTKFLETKVVKNFSLCDVSQQSELLTGFVRFERLQDYKYKLLPLSEKIEKYLASL
jgi:hypothetical protein